MERAAVSRIFIGPYGTHAMASIVLILFAVFLWAFNFTNFF
jgi:hypothetical protein